MGILAVIAVPTLIKIFKDAKTKTFETETKNIIRAAKQGYDAGVIDKGTLTDTTYIYEDGELISKTGNIDMEISGKKIQNGTITITSAGTISFAINDGEYCAKKVSGSEEITYPELSECTLVVLTVPSAPLILSAGPAGNSASITWNAPVDNGGSPIVGYKIERNRASQSWTVLIANTGNANTSYTDNSQPNCLGTYQMFYRIAAINATGVSNYSNEVYHTHTDGC